MSNYVITTESTCDVWQILKDKQDVGVVPLIYTIDEKEIFDTDESVSSSDFYNMMRADKRPFTTLVNFERFCDFFEGFLKQGKDVLHFAFTSALSGTCANAVLAAEELSKLYPNNRVVVVDTLCASAGQGLFVLKALELRDNGMNLDNLKEWAERTKLNMSHRFTVMDLKYLERTGRVSKVAAIVGTLLSVKPVLHVDNNGKLIAINKVRGRKQSLMALFEAMDKTVGDWENDTVYISQADCMDDAEYLKSLIKQRYPKTSVEITNIGPVIGSHAGPGTVALFFFANER
jgi:DegV family protein with EDD domain